MRLSETERIHIKNTAQSIYGENCRILLFGSRADDRKKGGDIDLFVIPVEKESESEALEKKIQFLVMLKEKIGDQKIDLVVAGDPGRLIEQEALSKGIEL